MYFTSTQVVTLLTTVLAKPPLATANNICIFSYMEQTDALPAGFRPRSWLIDRWLALKNEPFLWSTNNADLAEVVARAGGDIESLITAVDFDGDVSANQISGENLIVARSK